MNIWKKGVIGFGLLVVIATVAWAGELADLFHQQHPAPLNFSPQSNATPNPHGITEIGLERGPAGGRYVSTVYTLVFKNDGTVHFNGMDGERNGEYTGKIPIADFNRLAEVVEDLRFMQLDASYGNNQPGAPTVYAYLVKDGEKKVVADRNAAGPANFWAIQVLIGNTGANATWDPPIQIFPIRPPQPISGQSTTTGTAATTSSTQTSQ